MIYFPDFCQLVLERFREDETQEEDFRENMFKVGLEIIFLSVACAVWGQIMCGTEPFPTEYKARKYRLDKHSLTKVVHLFLASFLNIFQHDFQHIMKNLSVPVEDEDIEEMFEFADKDKDGKLSYEEFLVRKHLKCFS